MDGKEIVVSLTSKNSRKVFVDAGQVSFSIGAKDVSKGKLGRDVIQR